MSSDQVGLIGYGAEQGATLTDLGWVLVSLAIVGQGPSNATMPMLPRWRHWRSSLSVPAARLLRCEPHRWLQHVDDSGREWLVRNVRVDELHSGSELGLFGGAEGWRRQRVQERVQGIWELGVQLQQRVQYTRHLRQLVDNQTRAQNLFYYSTN